MMSLTIEDYQHELRRLQLENGALRAALGYSSEYLKAPEVKRFGTGASLDSFDLQHARVDIIGREKAVLLYKTFQTLAPRLTPDKHVLINLHYSEEKRGGTDDDRRLPLLQLRIDGTIYESYEEQA